MKLENVIASNSQYVVGGIVNTLLILAGVNAKGLKKVFITKNVIRAFFYFIKTNE